MMRQRAMDRVLVVFVLLWSSGLQIEESDVFKEIEDIRLIGRSRCSGQLEVKQGGVWKTMHDRGWDLKLANVVCRHLDCGSVVQTASKIFDNDNKDSMHATSPCLNSGSSLRKCLTKRSIASYTILDIICSDSVSLVDGTSLCSGRLEVKSYQSEPSWSSVCEADFDQQDAEVVCRELRCGPPSVLQGALYGEVEAPTWTKEFQCGGNESTLLDCKSSGSVQTSCPSGQAVRLTCSEPDIVRLVGESSRCAGVLELKQQGKWMTVDDITDQWNLNTADVVCRELNCGFAVSTGRKERNYYLFIWQIRSTCLQSGSAFRECVYTMKDQSIFDLEVICSGSVRLVNGSSSCSGRLEVKSDQRWSSVCEADFDQQDAEVVCRQLGCGAPSVLQGVLFGEIEPPIWSKKCEGNESSLQDCVESGSTRNTCSPGKAVELTCSEPDEVQLVGEASRCAGRLAMKHKGDWRPVDGAFNLMAAAVVCRQLNCGSAISTGRRTDEYYKAVWKIASSCDQPESAIRKCALLWHDDSQYRQEIFCSDSVSLVDGTSLCSGRLEVKSYQSEPSWSSVCEADFDQQDAEVVCRELGCGPPSVLQGALYGEVEAPTWTKEFQCGGNESTLLDCKSSGSVQTSCPSGQAVRLTCSEPDIVRLVGESSRCAGVLELQQQGEWLTVDDITDQWNLKTADVVCRELNCGFAVSTGRKKQNDANDRWQIRSTCLQSGSAFRECVYTMKDQSIFDLEVICSDSLPPALISFTLIDGVSEATQQGFQVLLGSNFSITCSIEPQYPGGSFQLIFTNSATSQNYTQPAVNHSAHFLFSTASHAQQGEYRCVYHVYIFSHNFSSESRTLGVNVSASLTELLIRLVVLVLVLVLTVGSSAAVLYYYKATRGQPPKQEANMELDHLGGAEDCPGEEAGARGTD